MYYVFLPEEVVDVTVVFKYKDGKYLCNFIWNLELDDYDKEEKQNEIEGFLRSKILEYGTIDLEKSSCGTYNKVIYTPLIDEKIMEFGEVRALVKFK